MRFVDLKAVRYLHERAMKAMGEAPSSFRGGNHGLGQLDSAVNRQYTAHQYEEDADEVRIAALLAIGISQAQAYIDGNKRTAYMVLGTFLRLNGWMLDLDDGGLAVAEQLQTVSRRTAAKRTALDEATKDFEQWLRGHVTPSTRPRRAIRRSRGD